MFVFQRYVTTIWQKGLGDPDIFGLEARIFHAVCLLIMSGTLLNIPFNYAIGLRQLSLIMAVILLLTGVVYYQSRSKQQTRRAVFIFQVLANILLAVNYVFNAGMNGPTIAIFLLALVITLTTVPRQQYPVWLPLNAATFLGLILMESTGYLKIQNTYLKAGARVEDLVYTYLVVCALITFILVFVRKAYEREHQAVRVKNEALQLSDQTKNKLLSVMAHDIKDPLASLQNYLELISEYRIDEAERADLEEQLLQRTRQASELLHDVLAWTRSQMGGLQAVLQPLFAQKLLRKTLQSLQDMAKDKGIELQAKADPGLCLMADRDMLQVILRNLVVNAIKFSYPGGQVTVSAVATEQLARITVADNGGGMTAAQQANLFSLSTDQTLGTGNERGTGLGLMLCKNLAELQHGLLRVESEPGKGTRVMIDLPVCSTEEPVTRQAEKVIH